MLTTIQIIALVQGLFLIGILFMKRNSYKKPALWLLIASILSVLLFILGDDENSLIPKKFDLFFFDISLFVTFLYLFISYYVSQRDTFQKRDLLYFIPNIAYFLNEVYEITSNFEEFLLINIFELLIELSFLLYLVVSVIRLFRSKRQKWMLFFIVPMALLIGSSIVNEVLGWFGFEEFSFFNDANKDEAKKISKMANIF